MIGSARVVIAAVAALLTLICVVVAWVTLTANGVLVLAVVFLAVTIWAVGGFRRAFWVGRGPSDRSRLDRLDGK